MSAPPNIPRPRVATPAASSDPAPEPTHDGAPARTRNRTAARARRRALDPARDQVLDPSRDAGLDRPRERALDPVRDQALDPSGDTAPVQPHSLVLDPTPDPLPDPLPDQGRAPNLLWYLTEPTRAVVDIGQFAAARSLLRAAPSGDGHTVLVLPGLGATDSSTAPLRRFLANLGYTVHGWGLGLNIGPSVRVVEGMHDRLTRLADNGPVSLVGWSLGGIFARELAREQPAAIRQVITLGSPYAMTDLRQTRVNPVYQLLTRFYVAGATRPPPEHTRPPIPVPATSVYSKSDGIVAWQTCIEEPGARRENVAVASSHLGYGHNATVWWIIADRLAQAVGDWRPFTPPPGMARMFPAA
jgi:pimeloyl-ACP methyl ester carboxylesterase